MAPIDDRSGAGYRQFGEALGVAFQIRDDLLGLWGNPSQTGKSTSDNLVEAKKTLPLLRALSTLPPAEAERIRSIYRPGAVGEVEAAEILRLIESTDAREYCEREARRHYDQAVEKLDELQPAEPAGGQLHQLAEFLILRES